MFWLVLIILLIVAFANPDATAAVIGLLLSIGVIGGVLFLLIAGIALIAG